MKIRTLLTGSLICTSMLFGSIAQADEALVLQAEISDIAAECTNQGYLVPLQVSPEELIKNMNKVRDVSIQLMSDTDKRQYARELPMYYRDLKKNCRDVYDILKGNGGIFSFVENPQSM